MLVCRSHDATGVVNRGGDSSLQQNRFPVEESGSTAASRQVSRSEWAALLCLRRWLARITSNCSALGGPQERWLRLSRPRVLASLRETIKSSLFKLSCGNFFFAFETWTDGSS